MERIQTLLAERELDALLVTDLVNVRWLTGFPSSNAVVVVLPDRMVLLTDFRYVAGARRAVRRAEVAEGKRDLVDDAVALLPARARVGFEDQVMTVAARARWGDAAGEGRELVGLGGDVERLRAVKDPAELAAIQAAVALADDTLLAVLERGLVGKRESEVAALLQYEMRVRGAQRDSFPPIVASGDRSDSPHSTPTDAVIERDTLVLIDFGAELDGFCSDGTRTFATGDVERRDARGLRARAPRPARGAGGRPGGRDGARGRRRGPRGHRGRRARRALRPRPGPRGRDEDPRGAAAHPAIRPGPRAGARRERRAGRVPRGPLRRADRGSRGRDGRRHREHVVDHRRT